MRGQRSSKQEHQTELCRLRISKNVTRFDTSAVESVIDRLRELSGAASTEFIGRMRTLAMSFNRSYAATLATTTC